jgi:choline dehydrogenase-like flavoprotein
VSHDDPLVAYFGYGSLVNRATHRTDIVDAIPARLLGWRRSWCPRPDAASLPAALLTVSKSGGGGCDGMLVVDRMSNLAAVDRREAPYRRVRLEASEIECRRPLPSCDIYVYEVVSGAACPAPPLILRSYLDAVMQGFWTEHGGAEGLKRFVEETDGFHMAIHDDRRAPRYPRAVVVDHLQATAFDSALAGLEEVSRGSADPTQSSSSKVTIETSPSSAP